MGTDISLKTFSYYIQKPEGRVLLRQFDATTEAWGSLAIDTSTMPEGNYKVKGVLSYLDLSNNIIKETSAEKILIVDRVLPNVMITYPVKSITICPVTVSNPDGSWFGIPVEGVATDDTNVKRYEMYYGPGDSPATWSIAYTWTADKKMPLSVNGSKEGQLGLWDVTSLKGKD